MMAKRAGVSFFEIGPDFIRAGFGARVAKVACRREDDLLVVELDSVETWEDGAEISLADLNRLLALIERECEESEVEVEFE
jgi:cobyrinic acid a,c-diamide synthase